MINIGGMTKKSSISKGVDLQNNQHRYVNEGLHLFIPHTNTALHIWISILKVTLSVEEKPLVRLLRRNRLPQKSLRQVSCLSF